MIKQIFINLPVKQLNMSKEFFSKLGFNFNPQFTDENAACLILGENIYAMLLVDNFFNSFTKKKIGDSSNSTEAIFALSTDSKEKVEEMLNNVISAGGIEPTEPQDHGWMYGRSFQDIDGHLWEIFYADESAMPTS